MRINSAANTCPYCSLNNGKMGLLIFTFSIKHCVLQIKSQKNVSINIYPSLATSKEQKETFSASPSSKIQHYAERQQRLFSIENGIGVNLSCITLSSLKPNLSPPKLPAKHNFLLPLAASTHTSLAFSIQPIITKTKLTFYEGVVINKGVNV